jgi:hypothetical protein
MPLVLVFSTTRAGESEELEVKRAIFEGESVRDAVSGPEIARHDNHAWVHRGKRFFRMEVFAEVVVSFAHGNGQTSRFFGPYKHFSLVDGIAYVEHRVFAFVDAQQKDWYAIDLASHWRLLIVDPFTPP